MPPVHFRQLSVGLVAACLLALAGPSAAARPEPAKPELALVTYVGFRSDAAGSSTIYADLTKAVTVESLGKTATQLRYRLSGARVGLRNNTNPLLAQYFDSAVKSARLVPEKGAVVLLVELNRSVTPRHKLVEHAGGTWTLVIEFPTEAKGR